MLSSGFQAWALLSPALRGNEKIHRFQTKSSHALAQPPVNTALVTPPCRHSRPVQSDRGLSTLLSNPRHRLHIPSPPAIWPSLFALVSKHRSVIKHLRYHTPSLPHTPAAGLPCMVLTTGSALDSTPPYKSTSGGNIFSSQKDITKLRFHACYIPVYHILI